MCVLQVQFSVLCMGFQYEGEEVSRALLVLLQVEASQQRMRTWLVPQLFLS